MNAALIFLHFVGLMAGAAGGLASGIIMRKALTMPDDQAKVVRGLGPLLNKVALVGLGLLWATGLILVWSRWSGPTSLPGLFWVKFIFVVGLTAATFLAYRAYEDVKGGNMAAAQKLPMLGQAGGVAALLAVLFAAITFSG
jgi:hypothetical protein